MTTDGHKDADTVNAKLKVDAGYKMRDYGQRKRAREKETGIRELVAQAASGIRHLDLEESKENRARRALRL